MKRNCTYRLGDLICTLYEEFKTVYRGDRELARMAALATLNEMLLADSTPRPQQSKRSGLRKILTAA